MSLKMKNYLTNKDITISNDDFDIEKLEADIRKGYTSDDEVDKRIKSSTEGLINKADYDKLQKDYTELKSNYDNQTKVLSDTNEKMARVNFENKLTRKGFKEDNFDEVIKIRNSVYADEKDDNKAIDEIADRFKDTYFPTTRVEEKYSQAPNEAPISGENKPKDIKISRNTSIKDLLIK